MSRSLFTRIVRKITDNAPYFQHSSDCTGRFDISLLMKCTSTILQLAYCIVPRALNEYLQMGEKTSRDSLHAFCKAIMDLYEDEFFQRPTYTDFKKLYAFREEKHGFPRIDLGDRLAPKVPFAANDVTYELGYYLTNMIYPIWYRIFTKGQNQSQTEQNRERNWKEREKPRPKVQKD
ncbi:ALP1-like protein [Tanacetum coccineum]